MKAGDLSFGSAKLHDTLLQVRIHWDATKSAWYDQVALDFEEQYLAPLEPKVHGSIDAINRLIQVLSQARQECE